MKTGWRSASFSDVCVKTQTVDPTKSPDQIFTYVDVSSVSNKTFRIEQVSEIAGRDAPSRARKRIETGDVIFATVRPTLMRVAQVPPELHGHVCSTGYVVLRSDEELDARFLYYSLFRSEFREAMERLQAGASYPAVTDRQVLQQHIPLPPLVEQKRIVAVLDQAFAALDRARAHAEQSLRNASEVFDSALARVDGEQRLLGSLVTVRTGKLDANAAVEDGQYPFFTCAKNVYAIDRFAFDCEAILLAGNNAVGDFNVKHYRGKFNAYQRTYVITINDTSQLIYRYLYFQLVRSLKHFKEESVGAGTKFLKLGMINGLRVSVPTATQQQRVVTMLDTLIEKTQRLETIYTRKLADLDELKQSLLRQAFSGNLALD